LWEKIVVAVSCVIIISWVVVLVISPGHRFSPGTCGSDSMPMSYSTEIQPTFEESFLHEFREPEPDRNLTLPPMMDYEVRQQISDTLLERAAIPPAPDSVIGLYEFPDAHLLLVSRDGAIVELLGTGEKIQTFNLTPVSIGSRPDGNNLMNPVQSGSYNFSSESSIAIERINLVLPTPGNATAPLYIVNKTDIDRIFYPDGSPLASITSRSTFYARYGQRVERIFGTSEVKLDPAWKQCSSQTGISGEGRRRGDIQQTVKFARGADRILWSRLIVMSADIQQYDTGDESSGEWISTDSTGCSC
jgi:hypothetical protein